MTVRVTLQERAVDAEALADLGGEFTGGRQDQRTAGALGGALGMGCELLQDGEREGRGLAGAGLGDAKQILALEQARNGLRLDGSGALIALGGKCAEEGFGELEIGKSGHVFFFHHSERL